MVTVLSGGAPSVIISIGTSRVFPCLTNSCMSARLLVSRAVFLNISIGTNANRCKKANNGYDDNKLNKRKSKVTFGYQIT